MAATALVPGSVLAFGGRFDPEIHDGYDHGRIDGCPGLREEVLAGQPETPCRRAVASDGDVIIQIEEEKKCNEVCM